jgi:serine/threonine-protein kinase
MTDISPNTTLAHYSIISKLGAGGMGEVYLAQDTKLDRKVALKILPAQFAEDKDRMSRFVQEAKSSSALNHPNLITTYEIGDSEGTKFISMEFIDGLTLREKTSGPLRKSFIPPNRSSGRIICTTRCWASRFAGTLACV